MDEFQFLFYCLSQKSIQAQIVEIFLLSVIFIFESSSGGVRNNGGIRVTTYCTSSTTALQVWSMTHFVFYFTICVILEHLAVSLFLFCFTMGLFEKDLP